MTVFLLLSLNIGLKMNYPCSNHRCGKSLINRSYSSISSQDTANFARKEFTASCRFFSLWKNYSLHLTSHCKIADFSIQLKKLTMCFRSLLFLFNSTFECKSESAMWDSLTMRESIYSRFIFPFLFILLFSLLL